MNARDERLRQLLRDADPAREAAELGADEMARLRRTVVGAAEREPQPWLPRPAIALAFAAAMAAIVVGLALWRFDLAWKSMPDEDRAATSLRTPKPSSHHGARPSTTREVPPTPGAGSTIAAITTAGSASVLTTSATATRAEGASAHRNRAREPRTSPRSSPRAIDSPPAGTPAAGAAAETIAATQPASEPQRPYQLQLTAPGGTRIVWVLTSSSGR